MSDEQIVELFLARDESAILHTSEKYGSRLRVLSKGIVDDLRLAEECENDTYLEAWKSIPPHEPRDYLYVFLARIVRHISLNICRHNKRLKRNAYICELSRELEQCIPAPDDCGGHMDDLALQEMINGFLETLDDEKRTVFLRRYWFMDSISEISQRFGLSESKVKTMLYRTRNRLRDYLNKEGYHL